MQKIRIGIYGYGNLGKGVECAVGRNEDMELVGIFTRREPSSLRTATDAPVFSSASAAEFSEKIDVMVICGGSATDLPVQTPAMAEHFNVVDTFDTHPRIPEHFEKVNAAAKKSGKTAIISVGWDPGLFSLNRAYMNAVLPDGKDHTFWGRGVSQGHSDAIRRIEGVEDARQYTVPVESTLEAARNGSRESFTARQMHTRECYVVAREGANKARIEREIKEMPNYFAEYDTTVNFISAQELAEKHAGIPHGGFVIRSGRTGAHNENEHIIEYKLTLDSNPEFTSNVLAAYARAAFRLNEEGFSGARTVLDIAPSYLSPLSAEELRRKML